MTKRILVFLSIFIFSISPRLLCDDTDNKKLFQNLKNSLNLLEINDANSQSVENNEELISVLKDGINSFNLFAPYTRMEKGLKETISELTYLQFTLRSASSIDIYKKAAPATVLIIAPDIGSGTGFVIDKSKGLIVTNYHVTSGLKNLLVAFYTEGIQDPSKLKFHPVSVIRYSAKRDVAILKLSSLRSSLKELKLANISNYKVGEEVHTIGHPELLTWTYSHGLITALRNKFRFGEDEVADVIQIDASISPGNSGGPLLNEDGNVIGMVTFSSAAEYSQNLNFAVSLQDIKSILDARKNEETKVSATLQEVYGLQTFSYREILNECDAYKVDEDGDGIHDYISLVDKKTKKEAYRFIRKYEIQLENEENQYANILFMDINKDGEMDMLFIDYDLDNKFESVMIDANLDGEADIMGVDSEGNGFITEAWIL